MTIQNLTGETDAIGRMTDAYRILEQAKSDCAVVIGSEIENLVAANPGAISDADKKNLKKIAKAYATGKQKVLKIEAESMANLAEKVMP